MRELKEDIRKLAFKVLKGNKDDLLKAMDSSDIIDYLEDNYSLKMVDVSGGVQE